MTKGFHKKVSKRVPLRRRYKIEKRVKQHNKKLKKLARKQKQERTARKIEKREQEAMAGNAKEKPKMKNKQQ